MKEVTFLVRRVSDEVQLKRFRPLAFLINDMTIVSKQDELPGLTTTIKGDLLEKEGVGSILPRKTLISSSYPKVADIFLLLSNTLTAP